MKTIKEEIQLIYLQRDFESVLKTKSSGAYIKPENLTKISTFNNKEYINTLVELLTDAGYYDNDIIF